MQMIDETKRKRSAKCSAAMMLHVTNEVTDDDINFVIMSLKPCLVHSRKKLKNYSLKSYISTRKVFF